MIYVRVFISVNSILIGNLLVFRTLIISEAASHFSTNYLFSVIPFSNKKEYRTSKRRLFAKNKATIDHFWIRGLFFHS